jgi:hypothetical protein
MLPIFRILPVGDVFLAILLLALALNPPASMHAQLMPSVLPMRGAMIAQSEHPEWQQFLILSAIRRADELNRLRELPDTPARADPAPAAPQVAVLPTERHDSDPEADDETGSIAQPPAATIPIDIGEPSAFELPVAAPEEKPPVIRTPAIQTPQRVKPHHESRIKAAPRTRHARASAKPKAPAQFDLFQALFGDQKFKQPSAVSASSAAR